MADDPTTEGREVLVDSNVLLDVLTEDAQWFEWSASRLAEAAVATTLVINPVIYTEVSIRFDRIEELDSTTRCPSIISAAKGSPGRRRS